MPNQREQQQQHSLAGRQNSLEAQARDQSMAAREQATHQVGMRESHENRQDLRQLNEQVKQIQQKVTANNESEVRELSRGHDLKRQELEDVQAWSVSHPRILLWQRPFVR